MPQLMHTIVSLGLVAASLSTAGAETLYNETVVHDTTTTVNIDLNEDTVLCSAADYGASFLKVGMPELAAITLLDHQNIGAGAPCVAAGQCEPGNEPSDILDAAHPTQDVDVHVRAVRLDEVDTTAETCNTYLIERVNVTIRGFTFTHERNVVLGSRPFADCNAQAPVAPAGSDDSKADDYGTVDAPAAGCSAGTGSTGGSLAIIMLGAVAALRRRKRA